MKPTPPPFLSLILTNGFNGTRTTRRRWSEADARKEAIAEIKNGILKAELRDEDDQLLASWCRGLAGQVQLTFSRRGGGQRKLKGDAVD